MGGAGSGRRAARVVRDQHARALNPDDPADLEAMAVSHHKALVDAAFAKAARGRDVTAELDDLATFEQACRDEGVHTWDGRMVDLIAMAAIAARRRSQQQADSPTGPIPAQPGQLRETQPGEAPAAD